MLRVVGLRRLRDGAVLLMSEAQAMTGWEFKFREQPLTELDWILLLYNYNMNRWAWNNA